jgi:quercetin dioxygenase-like cupin family protein
MSEQHSIRGEFLLMEMNQNIDPLVSAKNVYKFINENDRVRVLKVTFNPGDTAKMHHHPEHVVYVLKGGRLKLVSGGKTQEMDLKEGSVVFLEAQNHEATNTGGTMIELLVVELKK